MNPLYAPIDVTSISEPATAGQHVWSFSRLEPELTVVTDDPQHGYRTGPDGIGLSVTLFTDNQGRTRDLQSGANLRWINGYFSLYDSTNNVVTYMHGVAEGPGGPNSGGIKIIQYSTYGPHGNSLTQKFGMDEYNTTTFPGVTTTTYWNASKYFAENSVTNSPYAVTM